MGFERDDLGPFEALVDGDGLILGAALVIGGRELVGDAGLAEQFLEALDGLRKVGGILGNDYRIEGRTRIDQRTMLAIENQSAWSDNPSNPDPITIGEFAELGSLDYLEVVETNGDHGQRRHHHNRYDDEAR